MENVKPENIHFNEKGLIPAIVQDARSGEILMMAWMNKESLQDPRSKRNLVLQPEPPETLAQRRRIRPHPAHRAPLHRLRRRHHRSPRSSPKAPPATQETAPASPRHRGIYEPGNKGTLSILHALSEEIKTERKSPAKSYTNYLLAEGSDKIDKKIGEEASEVIIADQHKDKKEITSESCDLLYHLFVLWKTQASTSTTSWPKWKEETKSKETKNSRTFGQNI